MVRVRLLAAAAVVLIVGLGLGVRAVGGGAFAQNAGTVLYASMVYAGLFVLRPALSPGRAALIAVGFCWAVELFQLTGVPSGLPAPARLALGAHFDWVDVAWYPVGVIPLVLIQREVQRAVRPAAGVGSGSRAGRPPG